MTLSVSARPGDGKADTTGDGKADTEGEGDGEADAVMSSALAREVPHRAADVTTAQIPPPRGSHHHADIAGKTNQGGWLWSG